MEKLANDFPFGLISEEEREQIEKGLALALKETLGENTNIGNEMAPRYFDALYSWLSAPIRMTSLSDIREKHEGDGAWSRSNIRTEKDLLRNRWRWYAGQAAPLGAIGATTFADAMVKAENERFGDWPK